MNLENGKYETVDQNYYLVDMVLAVEESEQDEKKKKKKTGAIALLATRVFPTKLKGKIYKTFVRRAILYGSETWPIKEGDRQQTEVQILRQLCSLSLSE